MGSGEEWEETRRRWSLRIGKGGEVPGRLRNTDEARMGCGEEVGRKGKERGMVYECHYHYLVSFQNFLKSSSLVH